MLLLGTCKIVLVGNKTSVGKLEKQSTLDSVVELLVSHTSVFNKGSYIVPDLLVLLALVIAEGAELVCKLLYDVCGEL